MGAMPMSSMKILLLAACQAVLCNGVLAAAIAIDNQVQTYASLSNTTVTMTGRSELRLTAAANPLTGCTVHLNSPDAWLFLLEIKPSAVNTSSYLNQIRVSGNPAVLDSNIRIVQYANGAVVIPHGPGYQPLEIFNGIHFTGAGMPLNLYTYYRSDQLGGFDNAVRSFRLKRGYMATFAQDSGATGISRVFVADTEDLEIGMMPPELDETVSFVRVFPWRWTTQKGWSGGDQSLAGQLNGSWNYGWNASGSSTLNIEYVPMRHNRYWPSYSEINTKQNCTHVLGFNEPDRPDQANMSVADVIAQWPSLLASGLRLGSPAPSDGGLNWLYDFIDQADALNYRVDFVAVHYYRNNQTAGQLENWLWAIYKRTKRPLWVTEFNNGCNWTTPHPTYEQNGAKIDELITRIASLPYVERYSIYQWCTNREMFYADGSLTPAGIAYRDHHSPPAVALDLNRQYIGCYRLDETAGTTAADLSGRQHHATLRNGLSFDSDSVPGMRGYALDLDGNDDYLELPAGYEELDNGFSVAFWARPTAVRNWARFVELGSGPNSDNIVVARDGSTNHLLVRVYNGGTAGTAVRAEGAIALNTWQFFAVSVDRVGDVKIYKDGQLLQTGTTSAPRSIRRTANYIGRSNWSADGYFQGQIDDVRLFDYALGGSEVTAIYNSNTVSQPYDGIAPTLPCRLPAERFDLGGQGVASYDTTIGNSGGAFRTAEDVDIRAVSGCGGSFAVTDITPGEWLTYSFSVTDPGSYCVSLRAASAAGSTPVVLKRSAQPAFHAVGVYDEQANQPNAVDFSMGYSEDIQWTTGIGQTLGQSQVLTLEQFKPMVEAAFTDGRGGVIDFEQITMTDAPSFAACFDNGSKQFTLKPIAIDGASGTVHNTATGGGRTPISGTKRLQGNTNIYDFELRDFVGMSPQSVAAVGVTILGRNSSAIANWRVIAYYTNGIETGSTGTLRQINMVAGNTTEDSFSGIVAPEGYWITRVRVHCDTAGVWSAIDDLAFVFRDVPPGSTPGNTSVPGAADRSHETVIGEIMVTNTGSEDAFETFMLHDVVLSAGTDQILKLKFPAGGLDVQWIQFDRYGPWQGTAAMLPGLLQAEAYNIGGPGVAYYDTTVGNAGGQFRCHENVDVSPITGTTGELAVTHIADGEWLAYTVTSTAGQVGVHARLAAAQGGGQILIRLDDELLGVIDVPNTGSLDAWQTVTADCGPLPDQAVARLVLEFVGGGFHLDWIRFVNRSPYPGGTPHPIPGSLEFENYDTGGQNISYFDTTPDTNNYGLYRQDGVDILSGGSALAVYAEAGEWLEYTCDVAEGTYSIHVRHTSNFSEQTVTMTAASQSLTFKLPKTGGWSNWQTTAAGQVALPAGRHIVRFKMDIRTASLDSVTFVRHLPGDLDQDGKVDLRDLSILANQWLLISSGQVADIVPPGGDGQVDLLDLTALIENWLIDGQ
jgi:hypothetical protein